MNGKLSRGMLYERWTYTAVPISLSFRRSRFHWPNDNPDLFDEDGFPEPPSTPIPALAFKDQRPAHSRTDSFETFNGQYRRDELTHVRTIRVFEAIKAVDEKSLVAMLFPSQPTRSY